MKVSDILRVKGSTLYTVGPDEPLSRAVTLMADKDIGSLVVMEHGDLVGMLTFREVIGAVNGNGGSVGTVHVRKVMDDAPLTCTPETEIDEVRRMMLERHARYMPVMAQRTLMGVISLYDVAKAVVDSVSDVMQLAEQMIQPSPEMSNSVVDTTYITGIANINERLLILMDIESLMSSSDMGLINDLTDR